MKNIKRTYSIKINKRLFTEINKRRQCFQWKVKQWETCFKTCFESLRFSGNWFHRWGAETLKAASPRLVLGTVCKPVPDNPRGLDASEGRRSFRYLGLRPWSARSFDSQEVSALTDPRPGVMCSTFSVLVWLQYSEWAADLWRHRCNNRAHTFLCVREILWFLLDFSRW